MHFAIKSFLTFVISTTVSGCAGLYNCSRITDNPSAFQECHAKNGIPEAQYQMGLNAFNEGDTKTAIKWLKKAARDKHETITGFRDANNDSGFIVTQERTGNVIRGHRQAKILLDYISEERLKGEN